MVSLVSTAQFVINVWYVTLRLDSYHFGVGQNHDVWNAYWFASPSVSRYGAHIPAGEIKMTHGVALVNGFDVYSELAKARQFMGYCPQYDGLIGLATALGFALWLTV